MAKKLSDAQHTSDKQIAAAIAKNRERKNDAAAWRQMLSEVAAYGGDQASDADIAQAFRVALEYHADR